MQHKIFARRFVDFVGHTLGRWIIWISNSLRELWAQHCPVADIECGQFVAELFRCGFFGGRRGGLGWVPIFYTSMKCEEFFTWRGRCSSCKLSCASFTVWIGLLCFGLFAFIWRRHAFLYLKGALFDIMEKMATPDTKRHLLRGSKRCLSGCPWNPMMCWYRWPGMCNLDL